MPGNLRWPECSGQTRPAPTLGAVPVAFDTTGMERHDERTWFDPRTGDQVSLTYIGLVPDIPAPLDDLPLLRRKLAAETAETGSIIEAHVVPLDGVPTLFQLIKLPIPGQDTGLAFIAAFTVPRAHCSLVLRIQCAEEHTTGMRESTVAAQVGFENCFPPHPYAPDVHGQLPYSLADEAAWDIKFPDHPLTRARAWAHKTLATARIDPQFAALPPFQFTPVTPPWQPAPDRTTSAAPTTGAPAAGSPVPEPDAPPPGPGGSFPGSGGSFPGSGGSVPGGSAHGSGDPVPGPGGSVAGSGGTFPEPGGSIPGGSAHGSGGSVPGPGGTFPEPGGSVHGPGAPIPGPVVPAHGQAAQPPGSGVQPPDLGAPAPGQAPPSNAPNGADDLSGLDPAFQPAPTFLTNPDEEPGSLFQPDPAFEPTPGTVPSWHPEATPGPSTPAPTHPQPSADEEPFPWLPPADPPHPAAPESPEPRHDPAPPSPPGPTSSRTGYFQPAPPEPFTPEATPPRHGSTQPAPPPPAHPHLATSPEALTPDATPPQDSAPLPALPDVTPLRPAPAHPGTPPEAASETGHFEPTPPETNETGHFQPTPPEPAPLEDSVEATPPPTGSPQSSPGAASQPSPHLDAPAEGAPEADDVTPSGVEHPAPPAAVGDVLRTVLVGLPLAGYLPLWLEDGVTFWRMKDPAAVRDRLGAGLESRSEIDTRRYREAAMFNSSSGTLFMMDRFRDESGHLGGTSTQLEPATEEEAYAAVDDKAVSELYVWLGEVVLASVRRSEFVAVESGGWTVPMRPVVLIMLRTDGRAWHSVVETSPVPVGAPLWRDQQPVDGDTQVLASPATDQTVRASGLLTRFAVATWGKHPFELGLSFGPNPTL